jgi:hypothetical protein
MFRFIFVPKVHTVSRTLYVREDENNPFTMGRWFSLIVMIILVICGDHLGQWSPLFIAPEFSL